MRQRYTVFQVIVITAADTAAHLMSDIAAGGVKLVADSNNADIVTIMGSGDSAGIPLENGDELILPADIARLNQIKYQFASAGDILYVMLTR